MPLALLAGLLAIFLLGWFVYFLMTGSWGFGIGDYLAGSTSRMLNLPS
jgi:hypothetical protein